MRHRTAWLLCLLLLWAPHAAANRFTDPFAYCKAVGTIDAPDERYTGPAVTERIAAGLRDAFGLPASASIAPFLRGTSWRCMNGALYACNVGANLPCQAKADTSRTPTAAMIQFCTVQPEAAAIPMVVTGRETVYLWRCLQGVPLILKQVTSPDERGFLANIWYRIEPEKGR